MTEVIREDRRITGESTCRCESVWPGEIGKNGCPDCVSPASQFLLVPQSSQPLYDWLIAAGVAWGTLKKRDEGSGCHEMLWLAGRAYNRWLEARTDTKLSEGACRKRVVWEIEPGVKRRALRHTEARRLIRHHEHRATRERLYSVLRCLHGIEEWTEASRGDHEMLLAIETEEALRLAAQRWPPMGFVSIGGKRVGSIQRILGRR